jgi:hypothetical protein
MGQKIKITSTVTTFSISREDYETMPFTEVIAKIKEAYEEEKKKNKSDSPEPKKGDTVVLTIDGIPHEILLEMQ